MNIETTKIELTKKLFSSSKKLVLKQVQEILDKEGIVAYTVDGKPLTKEEYVCLIKSAEKEIENGNFVDGDNLLAEIKKW